MLLPGNHCVSIKQFRYKRHSDIALMHKNLVLKQGVGVRGEILFDSLSKVIGMTNKIINVWKAVLIIDQTNNNRVLNVLFHCTDRPILFSPSESVRTMTCVLSAKQ